jgi:hypothetical protein
MKNMLLAIAVLVIWQVTAMAYWPNTAVTRETAEREKLPLSVVVLPLGDGVVKVSYEVTLTGPFAHLQAAEVVVRNGDQAVLRFPVAPTVSSDAASVKGHFQVQQKMLSRCQLRLDCPVEPLSLSGQTFAIDLASYLK